MQCLRTPLCLLSLRQLPGRPDWLELWRNSAVKLGKQFSCSAVKILGKVYTPWPFKPKGYYHLYLSHPGLGWLYVFSSLPPCPLPQRLLPLMSKPFELNHRYLEQSIYRSGEMYWMTFPCPCPKVMAMALISKNLLVRTIKWEPLIWSLQNVVALLFWSWLLHPGILSVGIENGTHWSWNFKVILAMLTQNSNILI